MKNLFVLIVLLLFCSASFAHASPIDVAPSIELGMSVGGGPSAIDADSKEGTGMSVGWHDVFLPEAPTIYQVWEGGPSIVRTTASWMSDDLLYIRFGFLSGALDAGAHLDVGLTGATVPRGLGVETSFRMGMNLDAWVDGSIVGVPHAKVQIKTLFSNPTSLYATIAYGAARVLNSKDIIQASRLYAFAGVKQEIGPIVFGVAMGSHNTSKASITIKELRLPGARWTINPGVELLRSPSYSSSTFFVTSGSF